MARDDVLRKAWQDKMFRSLPCQAQALFCQLVVADDVSPAGVLPLNLAKWAFGCEFTDLEARASLSLLTVERRVVVDIETFEVLICDFIRDSGSHRHVHRLRGACKAAEAVKSPTLRQLLAVELHKIGDPEAAETIEILSPAPDPGPSGVGSRSDLDAIDVMVMREGGA